MCEFCVKHGEGKVWYKHAQNYSNDLLLDLHRRRFTEEFFFWIKHTYDSKFKLLRALPFRVPVVGDLCKFFLKRWLLYKHWGQVVPIEDVEEIFAMANTITRIPCICRKSITGKEHRVCFLLSADPAKIGIADIVDQSFFGGPDVARFETVDKETALAFIRETERKGMIHTVWTFEAPFIGGLCNCDYASGCFPMKMYREASPVTFRAEYVAAVEPDACIGCGACVKICPFDALRRSAPGAKPAVDVSRCYGCGICRSVCRVGAIRLLARADSPAASVMW